MYERIDFAGNLHILVARDAGNILGYHVSMIMPAPHGTDTLCGFTSFYFVRREYRGKGIGAQLFLQAAESMKGRGVTRIFTPSREHTPHVELLQRLGWEKYEIMLMRKI